MRGGREVSRLEGFSDAVFGFALTLLVVSLEVPRTFEALEEAIRGLPPFAICFALFLQIWLEHHTFFRRYALEDGRTILLNSILLFVVLSYVYPLKFLFTLLGWAFLGHVPAALNDARIITNEQVPLLMYVYAAGFAAVALVFLLLYANALRQAEALELTPLERHDTVSSMLGQLVLVGVGLASGLVVALFGSPAWGGLTYFVIGPAMWLLHARRATGRSRLSARLGAGAATPAPAPTAAGAG